ncbi:MAG: phenylacetate--CoA ligase family protein [Gilvibacter sp.]
MNLFNLTLKLKGFPITKAKETMVKIQALPDAQFEAYVTRQREEILQYHLQNNPYYYQLAGAQQIDRWADVPVLYKKDLQRPIKERLSKGFTTKNVYINKTSGSSGHPFVFAKDKFAHAMTWAQIFDRFSWYDLNFNKSLQARFYGIPLDRIGYAKERLKDGLSKRYRFPIFDLQEEKLEKILKVFAIKPFVYINGYTSSIVLFAKFIKEKGIVLTAVCPSLRACVVTSEMLYDIDKKILEQAFGVPIINEYGASELDLIAFTHPSGQFRLNSESLFVEILDDNNQAVPKGQEGRIVITSLYNKAHPFIRYDIGDTGALHPSSTIKNPVLKTLVGRTNDVANLPSGKKVPGLTFYYVTKSIIEDDGVVKEFVITQTKLDTFVIAYVSQRALSNPEIEQIKKALEQYLEPGLQLILERKDVLTRNASGKLKQFESHL